METMDSLVLLRLLRMELPHPPTPLSLATQNAIFDLAQGQQIIEGRGGTVHIAGMNLCYDESEQRWIDDSRLLTDSMSDFWLIAALYIQLQHSTALLLICTTKDVD